MDQGHPFRRPRAKAVAISTRLDERRRTAVLKMTMVFGSMAVLIEAALVAHRLWAVSQP